MSRFMQEHLSGVNSRSSGDDEQHDSSLFVDHDTTSNVPPTSEFGMLHGLANNKVNPLYDSSEAIHSLDMLQNPANSGMRMIDLFDETYTAAFPNLVRSAQNASNQDLPSAPFFNTPLQPSSSTGSLPLALQQQQAEAEAEQRLRHRQQQQQEDAHRQFVLSNDDDSPTEDSMGSRLMDGASRLTSENDDYDVDPTVLTISQDLDEPMAMDGITMTSEHQQTGHNDPGRNSTGNRFSGHSQSSSMVDATSPSSTSSSAYSIHRQPHAYANGVYAGTRMTENPAFNAGALMQQPDSMMLAPLATAKTAMNPGLNTTAQNAANAVAGKKAAASAAGKKKATRKRRHTSSEARSVRNKQVGPAAPPQTSVAADTADMLSQTTHISHAKYEEGLSSPAQSIISGDSPQSHISTSSSTATMTNGKAGRNRRRLSSKATSGSGEQTSDESDSGKPRLQFSLYNDPKACPLMDERRRLMTELYLNVKADKGFVFSPVDNAFVCQKKNHFQLTVAVACDTKPAYVQVEGSLQSVAAMSVEVNGVKSEVPTSSIMIEQSQTNRTKANFAPKTITLDDVLRGSALKLQRLHFKATTAHNMRKNGKPNPSQKYFLLAVTLFAETTSGERVPVQQVRCQEIIVRASNPGQYNNEVEAQWIRGRNPDQLVYHGNVGVNDNNPKEALSVKGNVRVTGHILETSDMRVKENISAADTRKHLDSVKQLKLYDYDLTDDWARTAGRDGDRHEMGVLAQELERVIPDAVKSAGNVRLESGQRIDDLRVVNKERVFMENVGAVQELCRMTEGLENRIQELESLGRALRRGGGVVTGAPRRRSSSMRSTTSSTYGFSNGSPLSSATSTPHGSRNSTLQRPDKDGSNGDVEGASTNGQPQKFPLGRVCAWLLLSLFLAVIMSVAVALLIISSHYRSNEGNAPSIMTTMAPTTASVTPPPLAMHECADGTLVTSVIQCPTQITFAFSTAYAAIPSLSSYKGSIIAHLAYVMGLQIEDITSITVTDRAVGIGNTFYVPASVSTGDLVEGVARLQQSLTHGTFDFSALGVDFVVDPSVFEVRAEALVTSTSTTMTTMTTTTPLSTALSCDFGVISDPGVGNRCAMYHEWCAATCPTERTNCTASPNPAATSGALACHCRQEWVGDTCETTTAVNNYLSAVVATPNDPARASTLLAPSFSLLGTQYVVDVGPGQEGSVGSSESVGIMVQIEAMRDNASINLVEERLYACDETLLNQESTQVLLPNPVPVSISSNHTIYYKLQVTGANDTYQNYDFVFRRGCSTNPIF